MKHLAYVLITFYSVFSPNWDDSAKVPFI